VIHDQTGYPVTLEFPMGRNAGCWGRGKKSPCGREGKREEKLINMDYDLIQTITGILGLISIILLCWQLRSESKWKKLSFSIDKIDI